MSQSPGVGLHSDCNAEEAKAPRMVAAIILAAGASTRLREPKQLVELKGERLLDRAVRVAGEAGCKPIIVVLGAYADFIQEQCRLESTQVVLNSDWHLGIASSIAIGIAHLDAVGIDGTASDATILMTCDQPSVSSSHLRRLIANGRHDPVASRYAGRNGVPACFPAHCFPRLRLLNGEAGARSILQTALAIDLPDGALDIDTQDSLLAARAQYE